VLKIHLNHEIARSHTASVVGNLTMIVARTAISQLGSNFSRSHPHLSPIVPLT
jgi:hypothetical protein